MPVIELPAVVYIDVDDVMWPLNRRTSAKAGVDISRVVTYRIFDNDTISEDERQRLLAAYTAEDLHETMDFFPDARLFALLARDPRFRAVIGSNNLRQRSVDDKLRNLSGFFGRDLDAFRVDMRLASMDDSHKKEMPPDIWTIIDDSPHNAVASGARHILLPKWPWNRSPQGLKTLEPVMDRVRFYDTIPECIIKVMDLAVEDGL